MITDNKKAVTSPWKPHKYTGLNIFCPRNEFEEIILLLLIRQVPRNLKIDLYVCLENFVKLLRLHYSEAMAARNAVLSQSSEFKEARVRALTNAIAVYDLLTVVLVRWRQFTLLQEVCNGQKMIILS